MSTVPLIARARSYPDRVAIRDAGREYSYADLLRRSETLAAALLGELDDLQEARVAYLAPAGFAYISIQWAVWRAGGVAVPLSLSAAEREVEYALTDADVRVLLSPRRHADPLRSLCRRLGIAVLVDEEVSAAAPRPLPSIAPTRRAMILYTSGTTSKPKGVVTTHANVTAQIESLVEAWRWEAADTIPLFLPLHHVHGIVNVLCCALWAGAKVEAFPRFDAEAVLDRVAEKAYSVFMAVPTIYVKLIQELESLPEDERAPVLEGFKAMRLMVSGSAALPASVHHEWTALTGQRLLERYGMTEIGMALANPYQGERRPGAVGLPLPGVEVRLVAEDGGSIAGEGQPGEIHVRGPAVFEEYWRKPEATKSSFLDGWFLTGDIAVVEDGYYRIMGRSSVDIIKSGGYKLSALEIESVLLEHLAIRECAVVGAPDATWGEAVAAAVVLADRQTLDLESLRDWCRDRLSHYKAPQRLQAVEALPRNAMGKVTKPAVRDMFADDSRRT